jgi:hypothetical protein
MNMDAPQAMESRIRELECEGFLFSVSDHGFSLTKNNTLVYAVENWPFLPDEAIKRRATLWEAAVGCATEYHNILATTPDFSGMGI